MTLNEGDDIMFLHESGMMISAAVKQDPAPGPIGHTRIVVHIDPATLIAFGLDRERRHREYGMDRQVARKRVM